MTTDRNALLAAAESELLPCPFCGCSMSIRSNRDWHRPEGDHDNTCPIYDSDLMFPTTDHGMRAMLATWNRRAPLNDLDRAEAGKQDSGRDAALAHMPRTDDEFFAKYGHENHCNLMFRATLGTDEDYCSCKATQQSEKGDV